MKSGYNDSMEPVMEEKKPMKLTRWEMETTINFNMEEKTAILYTRDKTIMRKLDRLVEKCPDIYKCISETEIDKTYEFPKKLLGFRIPRVLTEEQRKVAAERLAKARAKQDMKGEKENDTHSDA